jgi:hypothetical protein
MVASDPKGITMRPFTAGFLTTLGWLIILGWLIRAVAAAFFGFAIFGATDDRELTAAFSLPLTFGAIGIGGVFIGLGRMIELLYEVAERLRSR